MNDINAHYVITDGSYFLNVSNGQHIVNSINEATKFRYSKAENLIHIGLNSEVKDNDWKIQNLDTIDKYMKINEKGDEEQMCYIITDGKNHLANQNGWTLVTDKSKAQHFTKEKAENVLTSLPKIFNNKSLYVDELIHSPSDNVYNEISGMDGAYMDFDLNEICDDNKYMYLGETTIERDNIDFVNLVKTAIEVFSQLDNYVENMGFLERETDLKLMDIRHYKRDPETRLNGIEAQQLQYYEQELERERIGYKIKRGIATLFQKDINRIKDKSYISIVNRMATGEYKYRRLSKDQIKDITHTKRVSKLKAVV